MQYDTELLIRILSTLETSLRLQGQIHALMVADRRLSSAKFGSYDILYRSKLTGKRVYTMADYSLANDVIATIPINFRDAAGANVKSQLGGSASSSDPAVATVAVVNVQGSDAVEITPVSDGEVTITYSHPEIADATAVVDVVEPTATSDSFDFTDATTRPKA
jgi:hypothetical protein